MWAAGRRCPRGSGARHLLSWATLKSPFPAASREARPYSFTSQYLTKHYGEGAKDTPEPIIHAGPPLKRKKASFETFSNVDRFEADPHEDEGLAMDLPPPGETTVVELGGRAPSNAHAAVNRRNGGGRSTAPRQRASATSSANGATRGAGAKQEKPVLTMKGMVSKVIFHNEKTGWSVLNVKLAGMGAGKEGEEVECMVGIAASNSTPKSLIVTGIMPDPCSGEHVEVRGGTWEKNVEFGKQFKAEKLMAVKPETAADMIKYLGKFFPGVGPAKAKKIVGKFGDDLFDTIEKTPERLKEIPGINAAMLDGIVETYYEKIVAKTVLQFLMENGVSAKMAHIIWKKYKRDAIAKIKENPYILVTEFRYFAFRLADSLAAKLEIPLDSHKRVCAGVHYALHVSEQYGHCGMPMWRAVQQTSELLKVPLERVTEVMEDELADPDGTLVTSRDSDLTSVVDKELEKTRKLVFTRRSFNLEKGVAKGLGLLMNHGAHPLDSAATREHKEDLLEEVDMEYHSQSQQTAIKRAINEKVLIITGGPGVGKTRTIKTILSIYEKHKLKCLLCAPTGRAAIRLQEVVQAETPASTIHRLLESNRQGTSFAHNAENKLECDLLIVDEVSMVDLPLMNALVQALPDSASLLLVGDADQLPSVGPGQVLRDIIASKTVEVAHLTEVFRQHSKSNIIQAAHTINKNEMPDLSHSLPKLAAIAAAGDQKLEYSDFCFVECTTPKYSTYGVLTLVSKVLPKLGYKNLDVQVLTPMTVYELGSRTLNKKLQQQLNPPAPSKKEFEANKVVFREGDRVMQIQNNYDKNVFNGEVGLLVGVEKDDKGKPVLRVRMDRVSEDLLYSHEEIDQLTPAYAITIHKSQGNEYPVVIIPVDMSHKYLLHKNLIYTAITRGKKLCILVGTKEAIKYAIHSTENLMVTHRFTGLVARLRRALTAEQEIDATYRPLSAAEEAEVKAHDDEQPLPLLSDVRKRYVQAKQEKQ